MTERTRKKQARTHRPSLARTNPGTSPGRQFVQRRIARMGNSTVKSHQATEVRLKSRRKVNRPLRPIPSRAIEAGSGTDSLGERTVTCSGGTVRREEAGEAADPWTEAGGGEGDVHRSPGRERGKVVSRVGVRQQGRDGTRRVEEVGQGCWHYARGEIERQLWLVYPGWHRSSLCKSRG